MSARRVLPAMGCLLAALFALGSCASSGPRVYVNPDADMNYYQKVAILPFTSLSPDLYAGARVTRGFITELILTNRYEIVQPEEFRIVLDRIGGLSAREGAYDPAKLQQAAKELEVTGVIRGAGTEYQTQRSGGGEGPG